MTHARLTALFLGLLLSAPASAVTYKWVDESGTVVYSQTRPPEGVPYETIDVRQPRRTGVQPARPDSDYLQRLEEQRKAQAAERKAEQAVQMSRKQREEQCKAARHNLQVYTIYRRVQDEEGNVVRLDDNVRQQKIEEAKQAVKEFCD